MGLSQSPKIATDGLVFSVDNGNIKSYAGPAIQNLLSQIANNNSSGTGKSITSGTENVFVPTLGNMTVKYSAIQNDYPAVSTDCCPSPFSYGGNFAVTPSTLYTYAIVYKCDSGYTHPNYMYRYEYTSNGGTYVTEGGIHSNTNRVHLGGGWYWAWSTFTTQATTNWIGYAGAVYYRYSTLTDRLYIAKALIVQGDYSQMHPKYWPNVNTTRANTATMIDQTNTSTITANLLTYSNTGYPTFGGTNNYLAIANSATLRPSTQLSIEYVIKGPTQGTWSPILGYGNGNYSVGNYLVWLDTGLNSLCRINNGGVIEYRQYSGYNISNTAYQHMIFTMQIGSAIRSYRNGVDTNSPTSLPAGGAFDYSATASPYQIGGFGSSWLNADVPIVRLYNRALTAAEAKQNFNAIRGRFGL